MSDKPAEPGAAYTGEPQVHVRDVELVSPAGKELYAWMREWRTRHSLTSNEILFVLARVNMEFVNFMVLDERKPK